MNRSDIVVAKGRDELLVVYEVSPTGLVTCGVWLGHGVLTSEHRPEDLEVVARPAQGDIQVGKAVWHSRVHSLIHVDMIEGGRVEGRLLNPNKPGRCNVPLNEVAVMAVIHWLFWAADVWSEDLIEKAFRAPYQTVHQIKISPGAIVIDQSIGARWRVMDVDQPNAMVCVVPEAPAPAGHTYGGTWMAASQLSPERVEIQLPAPPYVSPFKVGDRVVCNDGKILGTVEAIECDAMHSILVREDSGDAEHWLPEAFRLATWHDEKPFL